MELTLRTNAKTIIDDIAIITMGSKTNDIIRIIFLNILFFIIFTNLSFLFQVYHPPSMSIGLGDFFIFSHECLIHRFDYNFFLFHVCNHVL